MSNILVTGANGFVGRSACRVMAANGHDVTALVRRAGTSAGATREWCHAEADFAGLAEAWPRDLIPDCVVHLAARVHVMNDTAADPLAAFRATNVEGAMRVARAACERGARRMVFVSSVKAAAEFDSGVPLTESMQATPDDAYGRSKLLAEEALWQYGAQSGLEIVIVRPPLVYGPDVGANFLQMMNALWRRLPLPLGAVDASRSIVYVENLADSLMRCATDARAANACFYVRDGEDLSVAGLLRALGHHLERPARLFPVPVSLLRAGGALIGRSAELGRLTQSLRVDDSRIRETLGWKGPFTLDEGLTATARWYCATH
ncbi:NAD-dependent epimerase/dehydratase family protein [Paraburkholderia sp. CNPSo 3281]|uniref:NAD-dependent epimerase/dehydratase family protein n=1 Tax=Paraburkholderia sp. CNPSo 3281 TaxID=2940933 RepID=UPI0020B6755E|nr:NAD-dependent epimerase/dehydratase family protein [Paraburkholderia sp. CNPSo 3281]MCP3720350.1 NAD-dependent epimerase/dehydratase family protein [Paraburkholderia sp. CNPSo 3281]